MDDRFIKPEKSKFLRYLKSYLPFWQKKKIGFYGNFGHGDLGDDAAFIAGRHLLGEDVLPISKRCYAFNPHILKAFLIGGGGILRWESPYIPRRILTKKQWNFPVVLFSAGINCDYNKEFSKQTKDRIRRLCEICSRITVRDKISQRFLNDLGFSNAVVLPDLELALEEKHKEMNFNKQGFTVGIVLTSHSEFNLRTFEKIIDIFSQFTNYLTDKGNDVVFISFERGASENTREARMIIEIMKRLKAKHRVRVLADRIEPQEMLSVIKGYCDIMVCMRLHSVVFSTNAGVPFFCISYNLMHKGFIELLDAQDLDMPLFDKLSSEMLSVKFEYVLENYSNIKSRLIEKRDYLRSVIYKQVSGIKESLIKN